MQSNRSPILMANIIFGAIVVGVVAGVGLRDQARSIDETPPMQVAPPAVSEDRSESSRTAWDTAPSTDTAPAPSIAADDGSFDIALQTSPAAPARR